MGSLKFGAGQQKYRICLAVSTHEFFKVRDPLRQVYYNNAEQQCWLEPAVLRS